MTSHRTLRTYLGPRRADNVTAPYLSPTAITHRTAKQARGHLPVCANCSPIAANPPWLKGACRVLPGDEAIGSNHD